MELIMIAGFCIMCTIICKLTEKDSKEIKILIVLAGVCVVFIKIAGYISGVANEIKSIFDTADIDSQYIKILFKGLGICCVTQLASDYCKDCGENALASQAELGGKIALLITTLPLFEALINLVKTLLM